MGESDFGHVVHPVLRRLIGYWIDKRMPRAMPSRGEIDPVEIPWALSWIWLCDYLPADRRFRFRLAGEQVNDFWGSNIGGRYLDEIVPEDQASAADAFLHSATDGPAIVHDRGQILLEDEVFATGERIVLPLSEDGREVTGLLGASCRDWRREFGLDVHLQSRQWATVTPLDGPAQSGLAERATLCFTP